MSFSQTVAEDAAATGQPTHKHDRDARINAVRTREICGGIGDATLWRWIHDPKLKFPKPELVNSRRYWRLGDVLDWWESRPTI